MTYRSPAGRAVTPQNQGRYPGFDVLDQVHVWDDVTAGAVLARLAPPNDLGFFTAAGRATGVTYLRAGVEHHQRAAAVVVAGYSIETPRLLLLSSSPIIRTVWATTTTRSDGT